MAIPRRRVWCALGLLWAFVCVVGAAGAEPVRFAEPAEDVRRLVELVERRLALMPEVAAWKWRERQPVTDTSRERVVLDQWEAEARGVNLDGPAAREFMEAQIVMARAVQEACFERWRGRVELPPRPRDLATELRPRLDSLAGELLPATYLAGDAFIGMEQSALLRLLATLRRQPGVTDLHLVRLARALAGLRVTAAGTWDVLQRVGVLRIGTTGDYAPFSSDHGGELHGLDIQLASVLAQHWGLKARFVRTTWPTLMQDLAQRRFDVAISGISITEERSRQADFSAPYHWDGKTAIVRCVDVPKFSSWEQIDQPGVRVVVNPGGTNERFVRERLTRATVWVHPDNRTIFGEIVAGRADVMFTDAIEVRLQTRRHPELCAPLPEPLTRAGKAVLLPFRSDLTARVDAWLRPLVDSGRVREELDRAVREAK